MPSKSAGVTKNIEKSLRRLGQQLRDRRKNLGISATITAEAAGMSRVTLYRIEQGEASVAMGAYLSAIESLGLSLDLVDPKLQKNKPKTLGHKPPQKIRISDYKQLKQLAWQLRGTKEISPQEALDLYERNWRHIDVKTMSVREQKLIAMLLAAFGRERLLV